MSFISSALVNKLNKIYDKGFSSQYHLDFFNGSGFSNFGYWTPSAKNGEDAANELVDRLVNFIPSTQTKILDVACGQGGTTKRLSHHFPSAEIIGINISDKQLSEARKHAPQCRFIQMNAEKLNFEDESFDTILCVEAAFHFNTREKFLKEAFRVLKPGGNLIMTDIIFRFSPPNSIIPRVNHIKSVDSLQTLFNSLGFEGFHASNKTNETWKSCRNQIVKWLWKRCFNKSMRKSKAFSDLFSMLNRSFLYDLLFKEYLLINAKKKRA